MSAISFLVTEPAVVSGNANIFTKQVPAGVYSGMRITITGETASGQTLGLDDLGTVFVKSNRAGQLVRADLGFLNRYEDLKGGFPPTVTGSANSQERVVLTVPFGLKEFPNVQQVPDDNSMSVKLEFNSVMATRFGSNPVTVRIDMIEERDIYQEYDLIIDTQNQQAQSAGTITDNITGGDIAVVYLRDPGGNVSTLNLKSDSRTVVDNTPIGILRDQTNIDNRVENAGEPWVEVRLAGGIPQSVRNRSNVLQTVFSGAGTMDLYKFHVKPLDTGIIEANRTEVERKFQAG